MPRSSIANLRKVPYQFNQTAHTNKKTPPVTKSGFQSLIVDIGQISPEDLPAPARSLKIEKEPPTSIIPGDDARRRREAGRRERTGLRAQVALERRERDKSRARRLGVQDVLAVELRRSNRALAVLGRLDGL